MGDTPRTDAEQDDARNFALDFQCAQPPHPDGANCYVVPADFARQLERKLNALEKAARAHLDRYIALVNSGDAGNWNPESEEHVINLRRALEVK